MTLREQIREIKSRIKTMAATQKSEKATRKGCPENKMSQKWCDIAKRQREITAHLNFYHAIRGSAYRHDKGDCEYWYEKCMESLTKEFPLTQKV